MRIPTPEAPLYLTKFRLSRKPEVRCLLQTLRPNNYAARMHTGHRLVWSLFTETGDEPRDFLWREGPNSEFYALSERRPPSTHALFDVAEPKIFAPLLAAGDRIAFSLRANPTKTLRSTGDKGTRGMTVDVVMHHKHTLRAALKPGKKLPNYREIEYTAIREWLEGQGQRHGFNLSKQGAVLNGNNEKKDAPLRISGYQTIQFRRGKERVQFSKADIDGILEVTDPAKFLSALAKGLGRAKGYGCGLLLIRRA